MKDKRAWGEFSAEAEDGQIGLRRGVSRRSFLQMMGFSAAAAVMTSCSAPEQKIIPFLSKPPELTPGIANWYASTCGGCSAACGVLVKVRDGRPIKLEGNPQHPISRGGLCPVAHGLVFELYDSNRLKQPMIGLRAAGWDEVDAAIIAKLQGIRNRNGKVRLITSTIGPTSTSVVQQFLAQFGDGKHILYEPVSISGIRLAHELSHGTAAVPNYQFDHAALVVSFGADFLGTWIAPVQFTKAYSSARNLQDGRKEMLRHVQIESRLSLTGGNADERIAVSPADEIAALVLLASRVAGISLPGSIRLDAEMQSKIGDLAQELLSRKGKSLVISASNDRHVQFLVNVINEALENYGSTIDLNAPINRKDSDSDMWGLVQEMKRGEIAALIVSGANPAYDYYAPEELVSALRRVPLKVSLNSALDETSVPADFVCPQSHFLESWGDAEPVSGTYSIVQPAISPLFKTRSWEESLLRWSGDRRTFYDALRDQWKKDLLNTQTQHANFDNFWDQSVQDGVYARPLIPMPAPSFKSDEQGAALDRLSRMTKNAQALSVVLYEKTSMRTGLHANNPWLQELPDPLTKVTWDNYACISPRTAQKMGLSEGSLLRISCGSRQLEIPTLIQPGQNDNSVAVALGYGRTSAGKVGTGVGVNGYAFISYDNGTFQYCASGARIDRIPRQVAFAKTQTHDSQEGRGLVQRMLLAEYLSGDHEPSEDEKAKQAELWQQHQYKEHKWGMVIDLNACTGCASCVISCEAENNIPVVGKDEVGRRREMHWLRIDRYYDGSEDNPRVDFQPVMCGQCDNASCESVCPALATVHSSEGLNMQVYNRCVGTRYCENNCAFKARRFNWFDYAHDDALANLALNPDVTVRTRGVMEKCTFCVQRIEEAKIRARNEKRAISDGEIQPACQQSCPANAIMFGDLVDLKSRIVQLKKDGRNYILLEELNVKPAISFLAKVKNTREA